MTNFIFIWVWILLQKWNQGHQNPWRAIPALQTMRLPECLLDWVKLVSAFCQPFNGCDLMTIRLHCKYQTRAHRFAIEQNCAGSADTMLTAHVRTRESQLMA